MLRWLCCKSLLLQTFDIFVPNHPVYLYENSHMLQDAFSNTTEELTSPLSHLIGSWSKTMESSVEVDPKSGFMHATSEFEDYANNIGSRTAPQMAL